MHWRDLNAHLASPGGVHSFEEAREESRRWRIGKLEEEDESGEETTVLPGQDSNWHLRNVGKGVADGKD